VDAPYRHSTWSDLETVNNEGTAMLDVYGRTYAFRLGDASKGNFAVVTGRSTSTNSIDANRFMIVDKTGSEVIYNLRGTVKLNNADLDLAARTLNSDGTYNYFNVPKFFGTGTYAPVEDTLIEYTLSGGKLSMIRSKGYESVDPAASTVSANKSGVVNKTGTILTVNGNRNYRIESSTLVYVYDASNKSYSVGSIKDLLDTTIKKAFSFIPGGSYVKDADGTYPTETDGSYKFKEDGSVRALIVNAEDAGAQSLFVMINGISDSSDGSGGLISTVTGYSFADGSNPTSKTWNFIDRSLSSRGSYLYGVPVKFRVDEGGILRSDADLDKANTYASIPSTEANPNPDNKTNGKNDNPTITGAAIQYRAANNLTPTNYWHPGSGGTFTLDVTGASWVDEGDPSGTGAKNSGTLSLVTFEANTVLYKIDNGAWVAMAPSTGAFNVDPVDTKYAFFKSDTKGAYDIIVRVHN
jgi:hypothetical protein